MKTARVLVVDDSTVIRKILSEALSSDPQIEVCGTAAHGRIALQKIPQLNPDIITLDMEMPEMDGLETLREIRKNHAKLPVVMFSTLTQQGASATMEALALGASDYVTKPANVGSVNEAIAAIRRELSPKIKALCNVAEQPRRPISTRPASIATRQTAKLNTNVDPRTCVLAIGSSTGGPNALQELLADIPADFSIPILVVQHMPPVFTKHLADRLNQLSPLTVKEAQHGDAIRAGGVWIAPGDSHMTLQKVGKSLTVQLDQGPPENSCRPAVDVLFRSCAKAFGQNTLSVVLTGMGRDGLRGAEAIRQAGGRVLVQDEASSIVWGMPRAVAESGLANAVIPLNQMRQHISKLVQPPKRGSKEAVLCQ